MWKNQVQEVYESLEELKAYDDMYGIVSKCGYSSAIDLWNDNPVIQGSTDPNDFGIAFITFRLTGTYCQKGSIGSGEPFVLKVRANTPKEAMDRLRGMFYKAGYERILFNKVEFYHRKAYRRMSMEKALGIE